MSSVEQSFQLFPLNIVLFPNSYLPLHIFEERYKEMIQRCLNSDLKFGVVLIKSGSEVGGPAEPYSVGTVARIVRVEKQDDGQMWITVVGERRFRIIDITQLLPCLEGRVELLEDRMCKDLQQDYVEAIQETVSRHVRLLMGFKGGWTREVKVPDDPVSLSYYIANVLQLEQSGNQSLLEELDAACRLRREVYLLERQSERLRNRVQQVLRGRFGRQ